MKLRTCLLALLVSCGGGDASDPTQCAGQACPDGMYCSAAEACVPDGGCLVDADCTSGNCSTTQTCLAAGACAADNDCDVGSACNLATSTCEVGGCGGDVLDLTYVAPNFLLVLDRSCSMDKVIAGSTQTKWEAAVGAVHGMLAAHPDDIRWGLTMFPDTVGDRCGQGAIPFPVGDGQAPAIDTMLQGALDPADPMFPDGPCVTNIDTAMQQAATDPALADPTRPRFAMLISDGAQSSTCELGGGDAGTLQAISDLRAAGVTTFIVGFGSGADAATLNEFAVAGGAPRAGTTKYYEAETASQLDDVFQTISQLAVSCEYTVDPAPLDVNLTYVFFENTELVPHDTTHAEGWDFDPATGKLTLYGTACTRVQDRTVDDVDVVFGCPVPPLD